MTVDELIEELQKYPGNALVDVYEGEDHGISIWSNASPWGTDNHLITHDELGFIDVDPVTSEIRQNTE